MSPTLTRSEALQLFAALAQDLEMYDSDPRRTFRGLSQEVTGMIWDELTLRLDHGQFAQEEVAYTLND
jgi:hypothetical protein